MSDAYTWPFDGRCGVSRKAWKKAALETHPDKTGTSEPFIRITKAYTTLMAAC